MIKTAKELRSHLLELEMEKAKKIFVNILFYLSLTAFTIAMISPIIVIIWYNTATFSLYLIALPLIYIALLLSVIPYPVRHQTILNPGQAKVAKIIFFSSLGISVSFAFSLFLGGISPGVFGFRIGPMLHIPISCFIAAFIIGILSKRRGWLYGIALASFIIYYPTAISYQMGAANMTELTFFGSMLETFAFPGAIFGALLVFFGGIIGGLFGEFSWICILKWRKRTNEGR